MKEVAILLLVALMLNGCGSTPTLQSTAGGTYQAILLGGQGPASGFSFNTEFTLSGTTLSITYFQFLNNNSGACLPYTGETPSGTMNPQLQSNDTVTGPFTFTVQSGGNTLALTGTLTATAIVTAQNGSETLTNPMITGNWTFTGSGTPAGCSDTGGSFTMSETSTT
jgi:hypothetical protein